MLPASLALLLAAASARATELRHRLYVGPEEIRASDTRALATLLVARLRRECDQPGAPPSGEPVLGEDPDLIVMVPAGVFGAIARRGFLNQHQTLTSGGFHRERDRFEAEQELAMTRLPFDEKGRELLPKYAVLDAKKDGIGWFRLPMQYGDVAVVFKKEVAERATWTYADSLDFSQKTGRFDAGGDANPVLARTFLYQRKKDDDNRCGNYCEAQVWGALSLDDAAYVMVRDSEPVPDAVARAGLAVYAYSVPESIAAGRTAQYVRGPLRVAAAPGSRASPLPPAAGPNEKELIAAVGSASSEPDAVGGFSPRQRLIGELASRAKSPAAVSALEREFASGDPQTRALALYGLSELPWADFKPLLLEALRAPKGALLISAVAFSAEHRDDADVAARLEALRRGPTTDASEWLERLDRTRLCAPR